MVKNAEGDDIPWYEAEGVSEGSPTGGLVSWADVRAEFEDDLGVRINRSDQQKYGWATGDITAHYNYLVAAAGLCIQRNAGTQEVKMLGALMESQLLKFAYAYVHRKGCMYVAVSSNYYLLIYLY